MIGKIIKSILLDKPPAQLFYGQELTITVKFYGLVTLNRLLSWWVLFVAVLYCLVRYCLLTFIKLKWFIFKLIYLLTS